MRPLQDRWPALAAFASAAAPIGRLIQQHFTHTASIPGTTTRARRAKYCRNIAQGVVLCSEPEDAPHHAGGIVVNLQRSRPAHVAVGQPAALFAVLLAAYV